MIRFLLCAAWAALAMHLAVKIAALRAERRRRDLDKAVDQALRLTEVPPEDRDDWGTR